MPLKATVWIYFMLFTIIVFALLWIFQIFFLEKFYEGMRIRSAAKSMDTIAESYEYDDKAEFYETVNETAVNNDICVLVLDKYGRPVKKKHVIGDCIIHDRGNENIALCQMIDDSKDGVVRFKDINPRSGYNMLMVPSSS